MNILFFFLLLISTNIYSQEDSTSGVSPEVLSLPSAPSSISGFSGEIVDPKNSGSFKNSYTIELPKGVNGFTPILRLNYDSSAGSGAFGQGWSLEKTSISRETKDGVPLFTSNDKFNVSNQGTLTKIQFQNNDDNWYSPIINESQDLFFFSNNSWVSSSPNRQKKYFGSSDNSRLGNYRGTTIWEISKEEDSSSNKITYHYLNNGNNLFLEKIKYAYLGNNNKFFVQFIYGNVDSFLVSYRNGVKIIEDKICTDIYIKHTSGKVIKHYKFKYINEAITNVPRLVSIKVKGVDDQDGNVGTPEVSYKYTGFKSTNFEAQDITFLGGDGDIPKLKNKRLTYIDINGDSLVDIVETSSKGLKVWINLGNGRFDYSYVQSEFIRTLGEKQTKLLDVDGDRIVDFVTSGLYPKFFKGGVSHSGKYSFSLNEGAIGKMPNIVYGAGGVKTLDLNGDGRLDFLVQLPNKFISILSTSSGDWDKYIDVQMNPSSINLSSNSVIVQDFNGDGLVDLGKITEDGLMYFPSLGNGNFGIPVSFSFDEANREIFSLIRNGLNRFVTDFNGDGIVDLAVVNNSGFSIIFGKTNHKFSQIYSSYNALEGFSVKGFWAGSFDINGNGVTDLVFSNDDKQVKYFSFVDVRPNLLSQIDNGLGRVVKISYSVSSNYGSSGEYISSINLPVVSKIATSMLSSSTVQKINEFNYSSPYYDGISNEFRGFREVNDLDRGDNSRAPFLIKRFFELGKNNYHIKGKEIFNGVYSFDLIDSSSKNLLEATETTYIAPETFSSLELTKVKNPLVLKLKHFEGDDDSSTADRVRVDDFTYDFELGFVKNKELQERDADGVIYRLKKTKFAFLSSGEGTDKICESALYNKDLNLVKKNRYFYDAQPLCLATSGLLSLESRFNGNAYQTKKAFTYYSSGNIHEVYDGLNNKDTYAYDNYFINLIKTQNAQGHIVSASYDSELGVLTSFTNENSLVTSISYDYLLRPLTIVGPLDSPALPTIKYEYTFGTATSFSSIKELKREQVGLPETLDKKKYFDSEGLLVYEISEGEMLGKYRQKRFEFNGQKKSVKKYNPVFVSGFQIDPILENGYEETTYDELGRVRFVYNPQFNSDPASFRETQYKVGHQIDFDELRNSSDREIDEFGRIVSILDAKNNITSFLWNARDQLSSIIDPQFSTTNFRYDFQGRKICKNDPNIGVTKYFYNANDSIIQKDMYGYQVGASCESLIGQPRAVLFEYDNINRKTKISYPLESSTDNIVFNYDEPESLYGVGKLTSSNYGQGEKKFEYNFDGNISKETQITSNGIFITQFQSDLLGRLNKIIYPTVGSRSFEVNITYSPMGKPQTVTGSGGHGNIISSIEYNPLEQVTKIMRSNGVEDIFNYDDNDLSYNLKHISISNLNKSRKNKRKVNKSSEILFDLSYDYDSASNVVGRNNLINSEFEEFEFDELNRLKSYSINSEIVQSFNFDQVGNITKKTDTASKNYLYDSTRKQILNKVGDDIYSYDNFGNIISDGARSYSFNWINRLSSLTKAGDTTNYWYDHEGFRVEKKNLVNHFIYLNKYTEIKNGSPIYHIFLDEMRVASVDLDNSLIHNHQDLLSSSLLRTNGLGNNIFSKRYYPFGEDRVSSGSLGNLFNLFTDQYKDYESDIYYFKQRYYSQSIGRFISADPLYAEEMDKKGLTSQDLNLYSYAKNNPIKYTDPLGLESVAHSRDVVGTGGLGRHLFIEMRREIPLRNQIISMEGKTFGGQPKVSLDGFPNDLKALADRAVGIKESQTLKVPDGLTERQFDDKILDLAEKFNVADPKNEYPALGGALQEGPNSNTFIDNLVEDAGGQINDFDKAVNQNYGE